MSLPANLPPKFHFDPDNYQCHSVLEPTNASIEEKQWVLRSLQSGDFFQQGKREFFQQFGLIANLTRDEQFWQTVQKMEPTLIHCPKDSFISCLGLPADAPVNASFLRACLLGVVATLRGDGPLLCQLLVSFFLEKIKNNQDWAGALLEIFKKNALEFASTPEERLQICENLLVFGLFPDQDKLDLLEELKTTEKAPRVYSILSKDSAVLSAEHDSSYPLEPLLDKPELTTLSRCRKEVFSNSFIVTQEQRQQVIESLIHKRFALPLKLDPDLERTICLIVKLAIEDPSFIEEYLESQPLPTAIHIQTTISSLVGFMAAVEANAELSKQFVTLSQRVEQLIARTALCPSFNASQNNEAFLDKPMDVKTTAQFEIISETSKQYSSNPQIILQIYKNAFRLGMFSLMQKQTIAADALSRKYSDSGDPALQELPSSLLDLLHKNPELSSKITEMEQLYIERRQLRTNMNNAAEDAKELNQELSSLQSLKSKIAEELFQQLQADRRVRVENERKKLYLYLGTLFVIAIAYVFKKDDF